MNIDGLTPILADLEVLVIPLIVIVFLVIAGLTQVLKKAGYATCMSGKWH